MKKILLLLSIFIFIASCATKQIQGSISSGNYDDAITNAVSNLQNNKDKKRKQDYIYLLEEAFAKAKERDLSAVDALTKDTNPSNLEKVFNLYNQLNARQEQIRPLLPLFLMKENRNAKFPFDNYTDQIINSKNALSKFLYDNSKALLVAKDKMTIRRAHDDLEYLNKINPNYKDAVKLMSEARLKGTDYVNVYTKNETNMAIPNRLQNDLLDFSTFGLNDKWTVYHSNKIKDVKYDFGLIVNFRQINISPEQMKEKEFVKEKQIKDGTKPLLDANGKQVRDDKGNPISVDNMKTIRVSVYEFRQFKTVQVTAKVDYIDLKSNQLIDTYPLASEYTFENIYSTFNGDRNACEPDYMRFFDRRAVQFPSNEQMIFDCGEDLKAKLKGIISGNRIRR
jgi:hypothetical protein